MFRPTGLLKNKLSLHALNLDSIMNFGDFIYNFALINQLPQFFSKSFDKCIVLIN